MGVDVGYNPSIEMANPVLTNSLKNNIAEFSAFKETSFRKQLEAAMVQDGRMLTWTEFKAKADELNIDYNRRWLKAEYTHTVATANMAQKLEGFERDKDIYPNLKFHTAGDGRVREAHKVYDGLVLPINHPFWKNRTPPLDWGCRCYLTQSDDDVSEHIPKTPKEAIANNPLLSGKIFNENAYEQGLDNFERKQAKENLKEFLTSEGEWQSTPNKRVKISRFADQNDLKRNYEVADICAKKVQGFNFEIRAHKELKNLTNPEYNINGHLGDRKSIEGLNGILTGIDGAKDQMFNSIINPEKKPYFIVWDLDAIKDLDFDVLRTNLSRKITETRGRSIKGMFFQYNGNAAYLSREQIVAREYEALNHIK